MKLYIGNKKYSSWSLRPWIVMKHFALPFEEQVIYLDEPGTAREIRAVSASGRVPVLYDGGLQIWDSLAICEYLHEKFPDRKLWPSSRTERAMARSVAAEMHSGFADLRNACPMKVTETFSDFQVSEAVAKDIARIDEIWRMSLERSGGPFLFGQFSIADAMYAPVVFRVRSYGLKISSLAREYYDHLLQHPAMAEWLAGALLEQKSMPRYETHRVPKM